MMIIHTAEDFKNSNSTSPKAYTDYQKPYTKLIRIAFDKLSKMRISLKLHNDKVVEIYEGKELEEKQQEQIDYLLQKLDASPRFDNVVAFSLHTLRTICPLVFSLLDSTVGLPYLLEHSSQDADSIQIGATNPYTLRISSEGIININDDMEYHIENNKLTLKSLEFQQQFNNLVNAGMLTLNENAIEYDGSYTYIDFNNVDRISVNLNNCTFVDQIGEIGREQLKSSNYTCIRLMSQLSVEDLIKDAHIFLLQQVGVAEKVLSHGILSTFVAMVFLTSNIHQVKEVVETGVSELIFSFDNQSMDKPSVDNAVDIS